MIESKGDIIFKVLSHIVMILLSLLAIIPMVLLLTSSFAENQAIITGGYTFWPSSWTLENYTYVFQTNNKIISSYGISIALTVIGTAVGTTITVLLGYALSRKDLPGRKLLTFIVFFTMLFNGGLIPTYMNYSGVLGLKNTFLGLLVPSLMMNAFNVMLVKSYFTTGVPDEILEAARIDGASEYATFFRIAAPMAKPIIATIALFVGLAYWNDWNNGYIYISTRTELFSIQNLLNRMQQNIQFLIQNAKGLTSASQGLSKIPSEGIRMSMAVMGILPVIIAYPFIQNNFVKGITLGGVKG